MEGANTIATIIILTLALTSMLLLVQLKRIRKTGRAYMNKWNRNYQEEKAMVLSISPTGKYLNLKLQVKIQVQVMPVKGRNFVVEIKTLLPMNELSGIQTGRQVMVRYDPSNIKEMLLIGALEKRA